MRLGPGTSRSAWTPTGPVASRRGGPGASRAHGYVGGMPARIPPATGPMARIHAALARKVYGEPAVASTLVYANHGRLLRRLASYNRAVEKRGRVPKPLMELAVLKAATVAE